MATGSELTAYQMGVIRNMATAVENGNLTPKRINSAAFKAKWAKPRTMR